MLLLITSSLDGTSDRLVDKFGAEVFRLNYDLWKDYQLSYDNDGWEVINPSGLSINSKTVTCAYWWKAFSAWPLNQDKYITAEVKYIFRDIYGWCLRHNLVKGNSTDFHNNFGKMNIINMAKNYFSVPQTLVTIGNHNLNNLSGKTTVVKSLASSISDDKTVMFVSEVPLDKLDPSYPWQLQEKIDSKWDITVFYCNKRSFAFKRSRDNLKGLDWRAAQDLKYKDQEWFPYDLNHTQEKSIINLSKDLGIEFGRYDFMENVSGGLEFLEYNANGQWVFLDITNKYGLLDHVVVWLKETHT
jgi:hypothetical protein